MTRRKPPRPIPTDEDLVRIFTGQAFKDVLAANWPKDALSISTSSRSSRLRMRESTSAMPSNRT
jgi:hypothetical protein